MDQQAGVGDGTRKGIIPSVNGESQKMDESSVKTRGYEPFDPL
jgi:hypothetical protein